MSESTVRVSFESFVPDPALSSPGELPAVAYSEHAAWGMMWKSKCSWTLLRDRPLPREVLEEALGQLIERHAALRAEFADPMQFFSAIQPVRAAYVAHSACVAHPGIA